MYIFIYIYILYLFIYIFIYIYVCVTLAYYVAIKMDGFPDDRRDERNIFAHNHILTIENIYLKIRNNVAILLESNKIECFLVLYLRARLLNATLIA